MLRTTLSLAVALVLTGSAAASASHPVVPKVVQGQIKHKVPALAYMPTRVAIGFRYRSWTATKQGLRVRFSNKAGWQHLLASRSGRGPGALARFFGAAIATLAAPMERTDLRGCTYAAVFKKPDRAP